MNYILVAIVLTGINFLYVGMQPLPLWIKAIEHSFFQISAIVGCWLMEWFDRHTRKYNLLETAIQPDKHLNNCSRYLCWYLDEKEATLDGRFTVEELRQIADYMEANSEYKEK